MKEEEDPTGIISGYTTFNLQGTHRYSLAVSNIQRYPDTLLCQILKYSNWSKEKEHFISQDGKLFRWICFFYNLGVMVDHTETGVEERVWVSYLEFFGLLQFHPNPSKRKHLDLTPLSKAIETTSLQNAFAQQSTVEAQVVKILTWMIETKLVKGTFVEIDWPNKCDLSKFPFDYDGLFSIQEQTWYKVAKKAGLELNVSDVTKYLLYPGWSNPAKDLLKHLQPTTCYGKVLVVQILNFL